MNTVTELLREALDNLSDPETLHKIADELKELGAIEASDQVRAWAWCGEPARQAAEVEADQEWLGME